MGGMGYNGRAEGLMDMDAENFIPALYEIDLVDKDGVIIHHEVCTSMPPRYYIVGDPRRFKLVNTRGRYEEIV